MFQALEDANAFVVSLDPERSWFRYHHLFGDLLRLELRRTAPAEFADLHRRAPTGSPSMPCPPRRSATPRLPATGSRGRGFSPTTRSACARRPEPAIHELLKAFPSASSRRPGARARLGGGRTRPLAADEAAATSRSRRIRAEVRRARRRSRFDVLLAANRLSLARRRGDFRDVVEQVDSLARPAVLQSHADVALGVDLRAVAMMNLGIAEMWSLQLDAARQHLETRPRSPPAPAARTSRSGAAPISASRHWESFAASRALHREAIALAERHGWDGQHS